MTDTPQHPHFAQGEYQELTPGSAILMAKLEAPVEVKFARLLDMVQLLPEVEPERSVVLRQVEVIGTQIEDQDWKPRKGGYVPDGLETLRKTTEAYDQTPLLRVVQRLEAQFPGLDCFKLEFMARTLIHRETEAIAE